MQMTPQVANFYNAQACKIVRSVMKLYNRRSVYTNKYATSRSVKCYLTNDTQILPQEFAMIESIRDALAAIGLHEIAHYEFRFSPSQRSYSNCPSLIVNIKF
jgi:hypothetical protein